MFLASFLRTGNRWICFLVNFWEQKREDCNCSGKILYGLYTDYIQPMIAEKYRSLSRWTRKMSELWLVNELDEKCSKQERLLIIIWILWFQVWHKYRNNNILTSLREWLIFTRRDRSITNTFQTRGSWKRLKQRDFPSSGQSSARWWESLFLCLREHIHSGGCGCYFTIWLNEKMILLFWQVENMKLLIATDSDW